MSPILVLANILIVVGSTVYLLLIIVLLVGYLWHKLWLWEFDRATGWKDIKMRLEDKRSKSHNVWGT